MKLRAEGKFPTDQSQALLHACEAEPGPLHRLFGIKTKPRIRDGQIDLIHRTHKRHLEVFCTAMLRGILKGFLQNAKETKCDLLGDLPGDSFRVKVDSHIVPFRELLAETSGCCFKAEGIQLGGVQAMRQLVDTAYSSETCGYRKLRPI